MAKVPRGLSNDPFFFHALVEQSLINMLLWGSNPYYRQPFL